MPAGLPIVKVHWTNSKLYNRSAASSSADMCPAQVDTVRDVRYSLQYGEEHCGNGFDMSPMPT